MEKEYIVLRNFAAPAYLFAWQGCVVYLEDQIIKCRYVDNTHLVNTINGFDYEVTGNVAPYTASPAPATVLVRPSIAGFGDVASAKTDMISWVTANIMITVVEMAVAGLLIYLVKNDDQQSMKPKPALNGFKRRQPSRLRGVELN